MRFLIFAFAAWCALGCGRDADPVWLGAAGPWEQGYGQMNKRGIDLAVEEINGRGGIKGRPLRILSRNDEGNPARAAAVATEYLEKPEIAAVVGHVTSGAMLTAARVYDKGLPAVATTVSTPELSGISPFVFRVISSDSVNGSDLARFARRMGFKRVAVLYENTAYGRGLSEAFARAYREPMMSADPIPADGGADFEPYVAYLMARHPDLVFVAGTEESGRGVLREARKRGLRAAFLGGDGWTGVAGDSTAAEGVYVGAPFSAQDGRAEAQRFARAFRERYHVEPDGNAALGYDATMLLARAIEHAGTGRRAIRDYLASLGPESAHAGATGAIYFLPSGDVAGKGILVTRVRAGALIPVTADGRS